MLVWDGLRVIAERNPGKPDSVAAETALDEGKWLDVQIA